MAQEVFFPDSEGAWICKKHQEQRAGERYGSNCYRCLQERYDKLHTEYERLELCLATGFIGDGTQIIGDKRYKELLTAEVENVCLKEEVRQAKVAIAKAKDSQSLDCPKTQMKRQAKFVFPTDLQRDYYRKILKLAKSYLKL